MLSFTRGTLGKKMPSGTTRGLGLGWWGSVTDYPLRLPSRSGWLTRPYTILAVPETLSPWSPVCSSWVPSSVSELLIPYTSAHLDLAFVQTCGLLPPFPVVIWVGISAKALQVVTHWGHPGSALREGGSMEAEL